jgi:hypothetical protein
LEYEEGMEKRDDIVIHGDCPRHGRTRAHVKYWIGNKEPDMLCGICGVRLQNVSIDKISLPCLICGFFDGQDIGGGNWVCYKCFKTWERISAIMSVTGKEDETPKHQQ